MARERYFKFTLGNGLDLTVCKPLDLPTQFKLLNKVRIIDKVEIKKPRF